ncbi:MAG: UDP-N-acetylmuramoyl-L-alanyl-D-glutamate--2,6-diaminopimelate ligase [Pseudohongiellaceae bacterium]
MNATSNINSTEKSPATASLSALINGLTATDIIPGEVPDVNISGVHQDSRLLANGDLFIACAGRTFDARQHIDEAVKKGVAAVLVQADESWQQAQVRHQVPIIPIDNLAAKSSEIAGRFNGHPSQQLTVIGITGTNGKTSCSQFMADCLTRLGYRCGVIGTLGYGVYADGANNTNNLIQSPLTTLDAVITQTVLAEMQDDGVEPVVMEVSSLGLHQGRVQAVHFDTAIFTNLSRDHLDYHQSMNDYAENKKKLFTADGLKHAIINLDDPYSATITQAIAPGVQISTYSLANPAASVYAEQLELTRDGYRAHINTPIGNGIITGKLIGGFNFSNLLAMIAALIAYLPGHNKKQLNIDTLCKLITELQPVRGRMEIISTGADITVLVDYAHTPDGLGSVLAALKEHFNSKTWCVFGCGGDRDKGKRPMMGEIAERHADHLIITDDNPRTENGDEIVQHILEGIKNPAAVTVKRDRAQAIAFAISNAEPGDVVLLAGKGHETHQDSGGKRRVFNDAEQARLALKQRANRID